MIEVGFKQACHTGTIGLPTPTRPEAKAPSDAAKQNGARMEAAPNASVAVR